MPADKKYALWVASPHGQFKAGWISDEKGTPLFFESYEVANDFYKDLPRKVKATIVLHTYSERVEAGSRVPAA